MADECTNFVEFKRSQSAAWDICVTDEDDLPITLDLDDAVAQLKVGDTLLADLTITETAETLTEGKYRFTATDADPIGDDWPIGSVATIDIITEIEGLDVASQNLKIKIMRENTTREVVTP